MSQGAGGYTNSQADSPTRAGSGPFGGGKQKSQNQSLRPVTIQQFHEAKQVVPDGPYMLDGAELTNVALVGQVTSLNEQSTTITYTIDDGTGHVTARKWLDADDNSDVQAQKRGQVQEGMEVKVWGAVGKPFTSKTNNAGAGDKTMTVFMIRAIAHPDEVIIHNLEAQVAHFYHTKGPLPEANQNTQYGHGGGQQHGQPQGNGGYNNANVSNNGYGSGYGSTQPILGVARPNIYGNNAYNQIAASTRSYNNGLTPLQNKIMDIYRTPQDGSGLNIHFIIQQLRSHGSEHEIREAIEYLTTEGHLYNSIDEEHFAAA
jgi:replication factor A2